MVTMRIALLLAGGCLLAACEPSVDDLVQDSDRRQKIIADCIARGAEATTTDPLCEKAIEAQRIAMEKAAARAAQSADDAVKELQKGFFGGNKGD